MPRDLPVIDVMSAPPITLTPDVTVEEAIGILVDRGIEGAPVVDEDGRLIGLLDDDDLLVSEARLHAPTTIEILGAYIPLPGDLKRYNDELKQALGRTVADVMDDDPPRVLTTGTVEDVATVMHDRGTSRVPVVDENNMVVGVVTRGDLVKTLRRQD
jgi:CBS domain-containing protein